MIGGMDFQKVDPLTRSEKMKEMRVRFAPSPTGPFHIGGARSALFNWLLAKKYNGKFVLRIEDTDLERSTQESEDNICAALKWLGINWDEGVDVGGPYAPYKQTQRLTTYIEYAEQLIEQGKAYYCFCSDEELEAQRQQCTARGELPRYTGGCHALSKEQQQAFLAQGRKPTVRFRVPGGQNIEIPDQVRGNVVFESDGIGDFVMLKSDGIPTYNYAVVIDDHLMNISHVIRAEEHLSNTPRQVLLYQAMGWELPIFGHISLILGEDKTKMSKRHGATSVDQYRQLGYLPEALVNFLALLGWSPAGEQEIFTTAELIESFSMEGVAKNPAVFDMKKLNYINEVYIRALSDEDYFNKCLPYLEQSGYTQGKDQEWLKAVTVLTKERVPYLSKVTDEVAIFFSDAFDFENAEAEAVLREETAVTVLGIFMEQLKALEAVDATSVQAAIKATVKTSKLKGGKVYMPIRVALTGNMHGPDLAVITSLFGVEKSIQRIQSSLAKLN